MEDKEQLDSYWTQLANIGKEVLDQAKQMGFGMSVVEIKHADGKPVLIVRSHTENQKYPDTNTALIGISNALQQSIDDAFDGARTFTVVFSKGKINRVLIDDYRNLVL